MSREKNSPDSRKENMVSLLTGLGKGYCCILLSQIRPEGKVFFRLKLRFAHTRRLQMCRWRDVTAGSSAPISPIRNLLRQKILANKSLRLEDLKCDLSLCQVSGTDSLLLTRNLYMYRSRTVMFTGQRFEFN